MQPAALNLIAIAVFAMTLSVYLVPLLHLSPFVPAAATLGVLGLVTVDGLTWQSRGMTLLLDTLAPAQQRQRIIYHEAGHFLSAYCLGIPITGYTLSAWEAFKQGQPGAGGVQFDTLDFLEKNQDLREVPLILERLSTVWMAGIAAEILSGGTATGGESDRQQLLEMLRWAGLPASSYAQKERFALLQAKNLLERQPKAYQALVEAMEKRASVEECYRVIEENL